MSKPTPNLLDHYCTIKDAAELLGVERATIYSAQRYGSLKTERIGKRFTLVEKAEVERYRREHLGRTWGIPEGKRVEFPIRISDADLAALKEMEAGQDAGLARIARAILLAAQEGATGRSIAKDVGASFWSVYTWIRVWRERGLDGLRDKARPGRKRKDRKETAAFPNPPVL